MSLRSCRKTAKTVNINAKDFSPCNSLTKQIFADLPTAVPQDFSHFHPQEIFMLQCFSIGEGDHVCDGLLTATELRQRGGTQRPTEGGSGKKRDISTGSERGKSRGSQAGLDGLRAGKKAWWIRDEAGEPGLQDQGEQRRTFGKVVVVDLRESRSSGPPGKLQTGLKPFGGIGSKKASGRVGNGTLQRPRLSTWRLLLF